MTGSKKLRSRKRVLDFFKTLFQNASYFQHFREKPQIRVMIQKIGVVRYLLSLTQQANLSWTELEMTAWFLIDHVHCYKKRITPLKWKQLLSMATLAHEIYDGLMSNCADEDKYN